MSKTSKFIVDLIQTDTLPYTNIGDGEIKIIQEGDIKTFELRDVNDNTCKAKMRLDSEDICFCFDKNNRSCQVKIKCTDGTGIGLCFDKNSLAAFNKFRDIVIDYSHSIFTETYYVSGNLRYRGTHKYTTFKLVPHGTNVEEYYDNSYRYVKYIGEFEEGRYDGEGTFYSKDKIIKVHINNISSNVPIDCGTIYITNKNSPHMNVENDVDFSEHENLDLNDNDFCYSFAKKVVLNFENRVFDALSIEDKVDLMWKKLNKLELVFDDKINNNEKKKRGKLGKIKGLFGY